MSALTSCRKARVRSLIASLSAVIAVGSFALQRASATDQLRGIVLMTTAAQTVVVHHGAFAGMPAMTMTFRVPPATRLHPGDRISATVDRSTDPWTLSQIRVAGSEFPAPQRAEAPLLKRGERVPDIALIDQTGRAFALSKLAGRPYALSFVYTRCADPAMCPLISAKFRFIQNHSRLPVTLVEVSLDPAYDRPPVLARYAAEYGADPARWMLATGEPRRVLDFAARWGILEHSAGPVTIVHSERLAIVGPDGRIARLFDNAAWTTSDVLRALNESGG